MKIKLGIDPNIRQQYKDKALLHEANALLAHIRIILIFFPLYAFLLLLGTQDIIFRDYIALVATFLFSLILCLYIRIVKRVIQKNPNKLPILRDLYTVILTLFTYATYFINDFVSSVILYVVIITFEMIYLNPVRYMLYLLGMFVIPSFIAHTFCLCQLYTSFYDVIDVIVISALAIVINQFYSRDRYHTFALESKLELQRDTDSLTGLMNKGWFQKMLQKQSDSQYLAVAILIDLDNFKAVNDAFGHAVGDQLLIKVGQILREIFREEDHVARIGGDEFAAFFIVHTDDWDMIERIAELKAKTLLSKAPILVKHKEDTINVTFSIGICVQKMDSGMSPQRILAKADDAMYEVKGSTKNGACLYIGDRPSRKIWGTSDTCQEVITIK